MTTCDAPVKRNTEIVRELRKNPEYRKRQAEHRKKRYKREQLTAAEWAARRENWPRRILYNARRRCAQSGMEFDLELSDIIVPSHCPVLGIPLYPNQGHHNPNAPSLDRFDNSKGYTKDNVRIISLRANLLKKDATLAEIEAIAAYMRGDVP